MGVESVELLRAGVRWLAVARVWSALDGPGDLLRAQRK